MVGRLRVSLVLFAILLGLASAAYAGEPPVNDLKILSPHVAVFCGSTNVGIVHDGAKALLIDCGDGGVAGTLSQLGVKQVDSLYFTHYHRDTACGAAIFQSQGAKAFVPAGERDLFERTAAFWNDPKRRWHLYKLRPDHLVLAEPIAVDGELAADATQQWGPARITTIATPGPTDGSVSFLVEADGQRFVFVGDAIYDAGKVWNLWSLQQGKKDSDYHGYLGARRELQQSYERIKATRPDRLIPAHGAVIAEPAAALDLASNRIEELFRCYVDVAALRYYMPGVFAEYANKPGQMPVRPKKNVPPCLRHFDTTWVLVSNDKHALAMDAGSSYAIKQLQAMAKAGEIDGVEGLWITHYHDDHVDAVPEFQKAFPKSLCMTDRAVAEVVSNPTAWRLPCISPSVARVDHMTKDGESWQWHEYKLTAYNFPGQTLYHAGLFVEGNGLRMLFAGDSFTPSGIDDYCMQNRNWLGPDVGYDRCIQLIERLRPIHIFNCHVDVAYDFTEENCRFMRANLVARARLIRQLTPWDDANYGVDSSWVRCSPYEQKAKPGETVGVDVVIMNHSAESRAAACRAVLPQAWGQFRSGPQWPDNSKMDAAWAAAKITAKSEGHVRLNVTVPSNAKPGRYVLPVDVQFGPWRLPQIAEAIVEL